MKTVSRRLFLQVSAGGAATAFLAACAPQAAPQPAPAPVAAPTTAEEAAPEEATAAPAADVVELRVTHAWPADQWARQVEFDEIFNKEHPGIHVTGENYPWGDTVAKLTALAAAGTLPDVIYVHYSWAQRFIMDGMMRNVQPQLDNDPEFWGKDDFVPPALVSYRWKGDQWLIPYNEGPTNLIYYNVRLFDEAGIPYPHSDGDWDLTRLWDVAKKLTSGEGEKKIWGYDGLPSAWILNGDTLKTWDAEFWNEPCEDKSSINSENAEKSLAWWLDFYKSGVTPSPADRETVPGNPFAYGRVAMTKGASWDNRWIKPNLKDPYDVAHAPVGPNGKRSSATAGSAYGITKDTENPDAAWQYLRAYNTTEGQIFLFSSIGIDPARWSAWPAYFETDATPPHSEIVMDVMKTYGEHNLLDGPNANEIHRVSQAIMDRLWLEELTPAEVCQQIDEQCAPIMAQNTEWCTQSQA